MSERRMKNYVGLLFNLSIVVMTIFVCIQTAIGTALTYNSASYIFIFYTVDSNVLCAIASLVMLIFNIKNIKNDTDEYPSWAINFKFAGTVTITLTFVMVLFFLDFFYGFVPMFSNHCFFMHFLTPVAAVLSFFFLEKGRLKKSSIIYGMLPTVAYGVFYLIAVLTGVMKDIYQLMGSGKWYVTVISYAIMGIVTCGIAIILRYLHNRFSSKEDSKKATGILLFAFFYAFAYVVSYILILPIENLYLRILIFDIIATVIIWIFSLVIHNSSTYDAYWSLTPMMIAMQLILLTDYLNVPIFIIFFALEVWGIRLTINWIKNFDNLKWEDWRYTKYRKNLSPLLFHLANFFGIMLMPTLIVYAGLLSFITLATIQTSYWSIIGAIIIFIGTSFELWADSTMHSFRAKNTHTTCKEGLWKYSRHPNYLGEILIWVGLYVALILSDISYWYLGFGMLMIILMFLFISIPMMEKRQSSHRSDYKEYKKTTSMLLLLPPKKI